MSNTHTVDLNLLRQVTADSLRVYEAFKRAQALTAEGEHILAQADGLLRQAGLAYLLEKPAPAAGAPAPADSLVSNYIALQHGYADLKDALYRLGQAAVSAGRWPEALAALGALAGLEPAYRDAAALLKAAQPMADALAVLSAMPLVRVPAGEFMMGSNDRDSSAQPEEKPQHKVYLGEYWIGKYTVTNAQYAAFAKALHISWSPIGGDTHPATNLTWPDAIRFCDWAGRVLGRTLRLPTEAEWEKAARGTDGRIYPWGNEPADQTRCNVGGSSTSPVGNYSPRGDSPYECADMAGNVWEWTSTVFKAYPYRSDDGRENSGGSDARVLRGGAVTYRHAANARCAYRGSYVPLNHSGGCGFRLCASPI